MLCSLICDPSSQRIYASDGFSGSVEAEQLITTKDAIINGVTVGKGSGGVLFNTVLGNSALSKNTSGSYNTGVGYESLFTNTIGTNNTAVGYESLFTNTTGSNNTADGYQSLYSSIGNNNTGVGYESLYNSTGNNNTGLGYSSGNLLYTGENNTFLGYGTGQDKSANTYNNSTAIGCQATINASNQIVLGTSAEKVKIPGSYVGIGGVYNTSSGYTLDVNGNVNISGNLSGSYSSLIPISGNNFISVAVSGPIIVAVSNQGYDYPFYNASAGISPGTVGSGGYIWLSLDSGSTFTQQTGAPKLTWSAVCMTIYNNTVYIHAAATGYSSSTINTYYTSFDYNNPTTKPSWTGVGVHYLSYHTSITGIAMSSNGLNRVIIHGDNVSNATFYNTYYGIGSWNGTGTANPYAYGGGICRSDGEYAFCSWKSNQQILGSSNSGGSYKTLGSTSDLTANNIACSTSGQYVTFVGRSTSGSTTPANTATGIYVSSNTGGSFTNYLNSSDNFLGISMSPSGKYQIAVSYQGNIYYSTNYGSSWSSWSNVDKNFVDGSYNFTSVSLNPNMDSTNEWNIVAASTTGLYIYPLTSTKILNIVSPVVISGTCSATSFLAYSDYRIKENIKEISNEKLQNLDYLKPVKYYNTLNKKQEYGFIAHELQEYLPELVTGYKGSKDYQTINYTGLIPILIKEFQEFKKEIQILKEKNK